MAAPELVVPTSLEIFKEEPKDMSIQQMEEVPYRPIATFNPAVGDLKFEVKGSTEDYILPCLTYLAFGIQILMPAGTAMVANTLVGVVNNFAHSVFQTVHITMGNQVVYSEPHYPYRANQTATMSYGNDAKESHLSLAIYEKDTAGEMDAVPILENAVATCRNTGLKKRSKEFAQSKIVYCRIHLDCDIFNIDKFIPNQVDMSVTLTRSRPAFCLMGPVAQGLPPPEYQVHIHDPVLWVTKAKIFPTIGNLHSNSLAAGEVAIYNMVRIATRPIVVNARARTGVLDNVTSGQLPRRMFYGFVKNSAFNGTYNQNPFNFEHMHVEQTALYVDGKCHPIVPFRPVYTPATATNYAREYWSLFEALGIRHGNSGIGIHRDDYPNGFCLYGFDISQNQAGYKSTPLNLDKKGTTRIEFQCSRDLDQAYVCMVFAEYDNKLTIDGDRNVYVNFSGV